MTTYIIHAKRSRRYLGRLLAHNREDAERLAAHYWSSVAGPFEAEPAEKPKNTRVRR